MANHHPCHGADTKTADAEGTDAEPEGPEEQEPRPPEAEVLIHGSCDMGPAPS